VALALTRDTIVTWHLNNFFLN